MPSSAVPHLRPDDLGRLRQHVSQVMAGVPQEDRCPGHPEGERRRGGFLSRLLGR